MGSEEEQDGSFRFIDEDDVEFDEESMSMDDSSSERYSKNKKYQSQQQDKATLDDKQNDSNDVKRWSAAVILMMFITAALVMSSTYIFLSREETDKFEKSFDQSAKTILDMTIFYSDNVLTSVNRLADTLATSGGEHEEPWPFVTAKSFEIDAAHTRLDSLTEVVMYAPFVSHSQRSKWEMYSINHQEWIDESCELAKVTNKWFGQEMDQRHNMHKTDDHLRRRTQEVNQSMPMENHTGMGDDGVGHDVIASESNLNNETDGKDVGGHDMANNTVTGVDMVTGNETKAPQGPAVDNGESSESMYRNNSSGISHNMVERRNITETIFRRDGNTSIPETDKLLYAPLWHISPPPLDRSIINFNLFSSDIIQDTFDVMFETNERHGVTEVVTIEYLYKALMLERKHWANHGASHDNSGEKHMSFDHPHSLLLAPVRNGFGQNNTIVGMVAAVLSWDIFLTKVLPEGVNGLYAVLSNSRDQTYTFKVNGPNAVFLGEGDQHETKYDKLLREVDFSEIFGISKNTVVYSMKIYPSSEYRKRFDSWRPEIYITILAAVFLVTGIVFISYTLSVNSRQKKVIDTALRTSFIVSSLFPSNVRDRILKDAEERAANEVNGQRRLKSFLTGEQTDEGRGEPIADFFPETTVMFADLVGFTAWSSVREPSQVFTLLETIYGAFDEKAQQRRVFKVETIGDCYVAVTGLPEPRRDHAIVMVRFAKDILRKLDRITKTLEKTLGPDTGDLAMRIGIHSGPVTAGVLRGDKARFQLFGDTMNTTARIESNGQSGRIHVSEETAELIRCAGKEHWLEPRAEKIAAKGKGLLTTFFIVDKAHGAGSSTCGSSTCESDYSEMPNEVDYNINQAVQSSSCASGVIPDFDDRTRRLIDWNIELLIRLLKNVVARRQARGDPLVAPVDFDIARKERGCALGEVKEIITLPEFDAKTAKREVNPETIILDPAVRDEVRDFVATIACLYHNNPFHNFEHVSHVAMSVTKLLSRIIAPADVDIEDKNTKEQRLTLHDHTYGITSDPLTQFACVFSALIHDVDHMGVPNSQLIQENATIAELYQTKSVAEQNSVDLAWDLLMDSRYETFRRTIYANETECIRFRQLVVNSVMATDIMDKDASAFRKQRWAKAFADSDTDNKAEDSPREIINRKATIVIEHLIQASDVSHTMQHWHIYRKWNERLFTEMYKAFVEGRAVTDPSESWYTGELGFFDFYIIPLARKLKDCGVFGVSSDEYLNYAQKNREEWALRGKEVVEEMKANALEYMLTQPVPEERLAI